MTKIAGSGSGPISQRHGSADPEPDPHQNVMDPEHWKKLIIFYYNETLVLSFRILVSSYLSASS